MDRSEGDGGRAAVLLKPIQVPDDTEHVVNKPGADGN